MALLQQLCIVLWLYVKEGKATFLCQTPLLPIVFRMLTDTPQCLGELLIQLKCGSHQWPSGIGCLELHDWKELSTVTPQSITAYLPAPGGSTELPPRKANSQSCSVTSLKEQSKSDRSGWSWKPARTLMKEMSHGRLMSPSPCQRVAEGGGITAGSVHIKMPWKVLKAGVALRQKHLQDELAATAQHKKDVLVLL